MIIGIAGKAGSGKDTLGAEFERLGWKRAAFAGPLKAMMLAAGMGEPADPRMKEDIVPGFDFTWRQAAQDLGTKWGRELDENIWVKIINLAYLRSENPNWIITDVRFPNECEMIRREGGFIIHLSGRAKDLGDRATHVSENPVPVHFGDITYDNSKPIYELAALAQNVNSVYAE